MIFDLSDEINSSLSLCSAASFTVNTTVTVVEGDTEMICARMMAIPAEALLDREVLLSLSTRDGTGGHACRHSELL